jgi:hypothetical protein
MERAQPLAAPTVPAECVTFTVTNESGTAMIRLSTQLGSRGFLFAAASHKAV